jgi:signal transduction histidine kinase
MKVGEVQIKAPRSAIALTYALVSSLWIVGSDALFGIIHASASLHALKGIFFVVATSVMLHCLVERYANRLREHERQCHRAERMQALGEQTARVTHELRNILMAVNALSSILQRFTAQSPQAARTSEQLKSALHRGELLISEVLGFASERPVKIERVQIAPYLADFADELRHAIRPTVEITTMADPPELHVDADRAQLTQLLTNLVLNASEAMSQTGRVTITASRTWGAETDGVTIAVRDDGPGIPEDIACRIFDPLFTTKSKGTGLGLPVVSRIAAAHGGTVSVESELGKGSEFRVFLPMCA